MNGAKGVITVQPEEYRWDLWASHLRSVQVLLNRILPASFTTIVIKDSESSGIFMAPGHGTYTLEDNFRSTWRYNVS